jgi:hypothetical protein
MRDLSAAFANGCVAAHRFAAKQLPIIPLAAFETSHRSGGIVIFPLGPYHNAPRCSSTIVGGGPFLPRESAFALRSGGVDQFDCELCVNMPIRVSNIVGLIC